tara:strand:+ start:54 stop:260 length:207 start_codon:yes stop_codon:yes gene_type:complete
MATDKQESKTINLTIAELENLIALGNRAQMTGVEADTWVALKYKIAEAVDAVEPDEELDDDQKPGGTA